MQSMCDVNEPLSARRLPPHIKMLQFFKVLSSTKTSLHGIWTPAQSLRNNNNLQIRSQLYLSVILLGGQWSLTIQNWLISLKSISEIEITNVVNIIEIDYDRKPHWGSFENKLDIFTSFQWNRETWHLRCLLLVRSPFGTEKLHSIVFWPKRNRFVLQIDSHRRTHFEFQRHNRHLLLHVLRFGLSSDWTKWFQNRLAFFGNLSECGSRLRRLWNLIY